MRLLSTKILAPLFKNNLIDNGFTVIEYPFIKIKPIPIKIISLNKYLIFTSQNAVRIVFNDPKIIEQIAHKDCFCVGEKTKFLLEENGLKVIKMSQKSSFLADFISKNYQNSKFSFFCGSKRRLELEDVLSAHKIPLKIHEVYNTILAPRYFEAIFDGILFFSPSAVLSYQKSNSWNTQTHGFCIGSSTAETLKKITANYSIAELPNDQQLLKSIHHYYTQHHAKK